MVSTEGEEFYTAEEACRALGVKLATLYSYVNRGLIVNYRQCIRRERLYRQEAIDALLAVTLAPGDASETPLTESWAREH